jgi:hypothetical protein
MQRNVVEDWVTQGSNQQFLFGPVAGVAVAHCNELLLGDGHNGKVAKLGRLHRDIMKVAMVTHGDM